MRKAESLIVAALLVLILGLAFEAIWQSDKHPQQAECSKESEASNSKNEQRESFWKRTADDPAAFFTALLALVAVGQAGLFVWQLHYMRAGIRDATVASNAAMKSADAAEKTLIATFRPKLVVRRISLDNFGSGQAKIQFVLANEGGSAASIVKAEFMTVIVGNRLPAVPDWEGATCIGQEKIGTGGGKTIPIYLREKIQTTNTYEFIKCGDNSLYF